MWTRRPAIPCVLALFVLLLAGCPRPSSDEPVTPDDEAESEAGPSTPGAEPGAADGTSDQDEPGAPADGEYRPVPRPPEPAADSGEETDLPPPRRHPRPGESTDDPG